MSTMHIATATRSYARAAERVAAKSADWVVAERLNHAAANLRVALDRLPDGSPHQLVELRHRAAVLARIPALGTAENAALLAAHSVFDQRVAEWAAVCGLDTRPKAS